jgi:uncharacterized protein YggT (Ycf19 family)
METLMTTALYEKEVVEQETTAKETAPPVTTSAIPNRVSRTSVTSVRTGDSLNRVTQGIWWVVGVVDVGLAIRFLFKLLGGSSQAGFVRLMYDITQPLVAPFHGIFNTTVQGKSILEPESLVAIVIYSLIGWGLVSMVRLMSKRPA